MRRSEGTTAVDDGTRARRSDRHRQIVDHLRSRAPQAVTAVQLARRFDVTRRTIERDLRALREGGVPLFASQGRGGGYSILPEYSLPPLHLTEVEALALAVALDLLEDSPLVRPAGAARDKILSALPAHVAAGMARQPSVQRIPASSAQDPGASWMSGILRGQLVEVRYDGGRATGTGEPEESAGSPTPRLVEPYSVLQAEGHWYLIGWCRLRGAPRGFRTDRVRSLALADERFDPVHAQEVASDLARWAPEEIGRRSAQKG